MILLYRNKKRGVLKNIAYVVFRKFGSFYIFFYQICPVEQDRIKPSSDLERNQEKKNMNSSIRKFIKTL